jgi:hypothetical protein
MNKLTPLIGFLFVSAGWFCLLYAAYLWFDRIGFFFVLGAWLLLNGASANQAMIDARAKKSIDDVKAKIDKADQ